jgi:short-subunit dehydrogenase
MLQTPEQIAEESWRRNESGVEVVVPGLLPKVMAAFLKYAPEQIVTPITRKAAAEHYIGD